MNLLIIFIDIIEDRLKFFENIENYFYSVQNNFSDKKEVIYKYDKEELSKQSKESDEITDSMESKNSLSLKTDDFEYKTDENEEEEGEEREEEEYSQEIDKKKEKNSVDEKGKKIKKKKSK